MNSEHKIGDVVRVEWNEEEDTVRIVMNITDPVFKRRIIHMKEYQDIMSIKGKDVMVVASGRDNE